MFVCFEGIDGAGKSTQARLLQQRLAAEGYKVELVADPGTTKIGTAIRQILLDNDGPITPAAQMLLFSAARAELSAHIKQQIKKKTIIVCDRWFLSTLVYQGVMNDLPIDVLIDIFDMSDCIFPDICFLLDLDPRDAKKRTGKPRDRYERKCAADRRTMRAAYLEFVRDADYAERTAIVPAEEKPDTVHNTIYDVVKSELRERNLKPIARRDSANGRSKRAARAVKART